MRTHTLYIKTPYMEDFKAFTTGDDEHINKWLQYVLKSYPHTSYYMRLTEV